MATQAINLNHFAIVPMHLINAIQKPRAISIMNHLLSYCSSKNPVVWIDQGLLASKMKVHRETVGRGVRYLEKIGVLIFTNFCKGRRKKYRINLSPSANLNKKPTSIDTSMIAQSLEKSSIAKKNEQIKEEKNNKEQAPMLADKEFSSNEKIALKQKLKALGLFKQSIDRLVAKYPLEKIELQITHLQYLLEQGASIAKPASWLIKAIEDNFSLPKEIDPNTKKTEEAERNLREASHIAQNAKFALDEGNLEKAKDLAMKSLQLAKNGNAQQILDDAISKIESAKKIEKNKLNITKERLEEMRKEAEEKALIDMRKLYKNDEKFASTKFFKNLVESLLNKRILAES